jgi:opacity protein-like surface antigen
MKRFSVLGGVVAIAAAALVASTPVFAADIVTEPEPEVVVDENNWYFSIHGGIKLGEDWEDDYDDGAEEFDIEADDGWRIGGAVGYSLGAILAIEGEISYLNQDFDVADDGTGEFEVDGDVSIFTGMVNLIAGFPVASIFRPYIGGGLGFAHVSLNDLDLGVADLDDSDTSFAAQAFAGIDVMLTDNMALGGRYRVLHIGDIDLDDDADDSHEIDPDLMHSIEAVLTVGF